LLAQVAVVHYYVASLAVFYHLRKNECKKKDKSKINDKSLKPILWQNKRQAKPLAWPRLLAIANGQKVIKDKNLLKSGEHKKNTP